ncbi:hypothetical protein [Deinococcus peraridilitoris]|uniref:Outer membrane protein beta-barrel domain-containing protein n=1 Tax=Deinococcus peraridilitoris (strain DSM 19664 / LMG 22246 / CIP 109416 / KR-200) TaxID=937777 RepID=K9ZWP9_DEIPD|nr:hypothetical protein [Deinococcus peraridilitoris]AFZ66006.1 hypothetical protein Deipe_0406 [Deinococcus peraridilitoris DSM 19664]
MRKVKRCGLTLISALFLAGQAQATDMWASANLTLFGYGASGGVRLFSLAGGTTVAIEGGWHRPYRTTANEFSLGAMARNVRITDTNLNAYLGGGVAFEGLFRNPRPYVEVGLHFPVVGAFALRGGLRSYPMTNHLNAGLGAEWHYRY